MPHQKLLLIMIRFGLITTITTLGWNFPLQEVAQPWCRWTQRDQLDADCKLDIIDGSHQEDIWKLLFSALRWTSYDTPLTPKSWWHPSLDMPSSKGTPVYAINDGEVTNASEKIWYGLSITLKHNVDGEIIFSSYSHLSEMVVKKWDKIKGDTVIWKVGCTWFSISGDPTRCGNHLDFQLTTEKSPAHPYGYGDCSEWQYYDAVEKWLCADKLKAYTIDPLEFFATHSNLDINYPLIAPYIARAKQPVQEHSSAPPPAIKQKTSLQSIFARLRAQNSAIIWLTPLQEEQQKTVKQERSLAATVQVQPTTQPTPLNKNEAMIDIGKIVWSWNQDISEISSYKVITLSLSISDKLWNIFIGTLPQTFKATIDNGEVGSFFPDQFTTVSTDKKYLFFQTRKPWTATLTLWYGATKISEEKVVVK